MKTKKWTNTQTEFIDQITGMSGDYTRLGQYLTAVCEEMGITPAKALSDILDLDNLSEEPADIRTGNVEVRVSQMETPEQRDALIRSGVNENEPPELDLD